jgi:hypothetical protein
VIKISNKTELPTDFPGRRTAIFGLSGSGKSNTVTVILEELAREGEQFVLIDPKGEGFGLLSKRDGKPSNLDVIIFGEPNGHVLNINERHGPEIANFVVSSGQSVVLSLAGFESDQSERRFVASFLRQLYKAKSRQERRTRTLVVFEEAHLFVPENAGSGPQGEKAELSGACQRIVRQGRSFGLGSLIVDQRPQDVAKRVISQCDMVICHALTHELDRKALEGWTRGYDRDGRSQEFLGSLASLQPGEAWIWAPPNVFTRTKIHQRKTFDSGASPDGAEAVEVRRKAVDLDKLTAHLATIVEEAKANDPKELKKRITELERRLAEAPPTGPSEEEIQELLKDRDREWLQRIQPLRKSLMKTREALNDASRTIAEDIGQLIDVEQMPDLKPLAIREAPSLVKQRQALQAQQSPAMTPKVIPAPVTSTQTYRETASGLADGQVRILRSLYWLQHEDRKPVKVAFYADLKLGGHFTNLMGRLRTLKLVSGWQLTDAGREAMLAAGGDPGKKPTGLQLRDWLRPKLADGHNRMIDALIAAGGRRLSNEELATASGLNLGGHFTNLLGKLRTMQIAEGHAKDGGVKANDLFFA